MSNIFYWNFFNHLSYICWVDVIYLTCLAFLKSPWWSVCIFCAPIPLTQKIKLGKFLWPIKNFDIYFLAHQCMPKIFRETHKIPLAPPLNLRSLTFQHLLKKLHQTFYDGHIHKWEKLTSGLTIFQTVKVNIIEFDDKIPLQSLTNKPFFQFFITTIFDGGVQLILNLKRLNEFLKDEHFEVIKQCHWKWINWILWYCSFNCQTKIGTKLIVK